MSQIGCSYDGASFMASFTAANRHEYEAHLEKLRAFADLIWPAAESASETQSEIRPEFTPEAPIAVDVAVARGLLRRERYGL